MAVSRPIQRLPYRPMSAEPILHRSYHHPTPLPPPPPSSSATGAATNAQASSNRSNNFLHPHNHHHHAYNNSHHSSLRHLGGAAWSRLTGSSNSSSTSRIMGPTYGSSTTHNTPLKQFANHEVTSMGATNQNYLDNQHHQVIIIRTTYLYYILQKLFLLVKNCESFIVSKTDKKTADKAL